MKGTEISTVTSCRDVIVKLPLGLKILRNQFHAPQAHVVVGGSGGISPPHNFFVS